MPDATRFRPDGWCGHRGCADGVVHRRARPRAQHLVGARAAAPRPRARRHLPGEQREPARTRRRRARCGPGRVRPDRRAARTLLGRSGALIEAIAKKHDVKTENVVLGCGSTQILRSATHLFTAKDKPLVGTIPTYEECAGLRGDDGPSGTGGRARLGVQDRPRQVRRRGEGCRAGVLLQPEQPDRHVRRRQGHARIPRAGEPRVARHDDPGRRGVLRVRHRSGSRHAHSHRGRESAGHRRPDVLEGVRHGRAAHRLRRRAQGHDQEDGRLGRRHRHELAQRARASRRARRHSAGSVGHRQPSARATRPSATSP